MIGKTSYVLRSSLFLCLKKYNVHVKNVFPIIKHAVHVLSKQNMFHVQEVSHVKYILCYYLSSETWYNSETPKSTIFIDI